MKKNPKKKRNTHKKKKRKKPEKKREKVVGETLKVSGRVRNGGSDHDLIKKNVREGWWDGR